MVLLGIQNSLQQTYNIWSQTKNPPVTEIVCIFLNKYSCLFMADGVLLEKNFSRNTG